MPVVDFLSLHVALPSQRISLLGADAISPSDRTPSEILVTHPSLALWGHGRTVCARPRMQRGVARLGSAGFVQGCTAPRVGAKNKTALAGHRTGKGINVAANATPTRTSNVSRGHPFLLS
jgi:hypothetical protein